MKNANSLQETDAQRLNHLTSLARSVLAGLHVPFTRRALRNVAEAEYHDVSRGGTVHAQVSRTLAVVDRRDSTNGLIVLTRVLRRYHVRCLVGESPADKRGVHIVARRRTPGSTYADALAIAPLAEVASQPPPTYVFFYANELSEESGFATSFRIERLLLIGRVAGAGALAVALVLGSMALSDQAPGLLIPAALSLIGLLVSGFLVAYELDPKVGAWAASHGCERETLKMSCAAVLRSRASKLFGVIPLADLGAVYFAAGAAWLLGSALTGRVADAGGVLFWYALAPLPLSIFAVAYQAAAVKAWCPLCLAVHGLLWIQAAVLLLNGETSPRGIVSGSAAALALSIAAFATLLYLLRRVLQLAPYARAEAVQQQRWTRDGELFKHLFTGRPAVQPAPAGAVSFGTGHARLLAVLSSECAPCRLMIEKLLRLHDWFDGRIAIAVILTEGPLQRAALRLTTASRNDEAVALVKAWFRADARGKAALLASFEDSDREPGEAERIAQLAHADWLKKHRVNVTPMLFFNERLVPDEYHDAALLGEMIEDHWPEPRAITGPITGAA
jgi:uncharacterized membrane protein